MSKKTGKIFATDSENNNERMEIEKDGVKYQVEVIGENRDVEVVTLSEDESMDEEKLRTKKTIDHAMKHDFIFKGLSITEKGNLLVEVEDEEIVRRETKRRYSRYLEDKLEQIEKMEEKIPELTSLRKQFAINEVNTGEKMVDKETKRVSGMIVVSEEAKLFVKY